MNPSSFPLSFLAVLTLVVGLMAATAGTTAKTVGAAGFVEQFVARAHSVAGAEDAGRIDIYVERWSTDDEAQSLWATLTASRPGQVLSRLSLTQRQRVGVVLMPGVQAHGDRVRTRTPRNLLLARQVVTPQGRQVTLVSDEHFGLGERALDARRAIPELNVIDIRIGPDGTGIGKVAAEPNLAFSATTRAFEVKDYAAQPIRLIGVRSDTH